MTLPEETGAGQSRAETARSGGSTVDDSQPPVDDGRSTDESGRSRVTVFRWTCPICGESRTGIASRDEDPREKAEFGLRQHVRTSEDDGHGPANVFPPGFDPDAAERAVSID